jgi:hypothetical protein
MKHAHWLFLQVTHLFPVYMLTEKWVEVEWGNWSKHKYYRGIRSLIFLIYKYLAMDFLGALEKFSVLPNKQFKLRIVLLILVQMVHRIVLWP